jgi:hypothetical protein
MIAQIHLACGISSRVFFFDCAQYPPDEDRTTGPIPGSDGHEAINRYIRGVSVAEGLGVAEGLEKNLAENRPLRY